MNRAPENSKIDASMSACLIVKAPEPTEVANALATSLAPIPKAATNAKIPPTARIHTN